MLPRDTIATGSIITNVASITFDANPALETPVWMNAFDFTPPTIQVQPLSAVQVNNAFELRWGSADVGSGIDRVAVDVSTNGADYTQFLVTTGAVSTVFSGEPSSSYSFRLTAWDRLGHSNQTYTAIDKSPLTTKIAQAGTNYLSWARQYFGPLAGDPLSEADVWGLSANPSGDGSPNFFKWYYNESPLVANAGTNWVSVSLETSVSIFSLLRNTSDPTVILDVMWTSDLSEPWSVLPIPTQATVHAVDGTYEKVTWPTNLQGANQGFYRLRLSLKP